jgi:tRNA-specific 2-thiouridylase
MNIAVGMSGGVDSAVAAYLLKKEGHNLTGAIMTIWDGSADLPADIPSGNACYSPDKEKDIQDAQEVCDFLDIPLHIIDCSKQYTKIVLQYFRDEYCEGRTPNPCVMCNQNMKFGILPSLLAESGVEFDKFATGHYCRIEYNEKMDRYLLKTGINRKKDQSYFLYRLTQEQLKKAYFPLGGLEKEEVRIIAEEAGLPVKYKEESQDFYNGDYGDIISSAPSPGNIIDLDGNILGTHKGIWNYTIGQRKGLGISHSTPLYVVEINAEKNEVVLGEKDSLKSKTLTAENINIIYDKIPKTAEAKIRSASPAVPCEITASSDDSFSISFFDEQLAITPGQSVVIYDNDYVIGGGVIAE